MKLQQLRTFQQIVAHGFSLTRAAEHLHASQPGLSRHIQALEQELGVDLFVRERSRFARLTPAGSAVLPSAQRVLDAVDEFYRTARPFVEGESDTLTIAASPTHVRHTLPAIIGSFLKQHPDIKLRLHEGHAARSLEWLAAGLADFSLSSIPREPPEGILFMPCGELHWSLLTLPDHPLLRLDTVSLADIARWPLITYESDYGSRTAITRAFTQAGEKPDIVMSAGNADAMRQYVLCGLGIAIVARSPREHEDGNRLQTIDIRHLIPSGRFYIGIRRAGVLGEAAKSVIGLLAPDALGQLASSGAGIA